MIRSALPLLAAAALIPTAAHAAVGVGASTNIQSSFLNDLLSFQTQYYGYAYGPFVPPPHTYPSLDLRVDETVVQIDLIETIAAIASEGDAVYIGANAWNAPLTGELGGNWAAFAGLGGSLDISSVDGDALIFFGPIAPIGIRFGDETRLALYAQPGLDIIVGGDEPQLVGSAALLASVWF